MSGQLVGEVLDAAEAGHLDGLSRAAVAALLAIAERCHHVTRQGSVRRDRIQAAIHAGNSPRTVSRAIRELKNAGLVRIVKHGYKSHEAPSLATIYELSALYVHAPPKMAHAQGDVLSPKSDLLSPKQPLAVAKIALAVATQGGALDGMSDGSLDGSLDGAVARAGARPPADARGARLPANWQPPPEVVAQQRADHPHLDLDEILEDFRDYWTAKTGRDATKRDWTATWRRWVRTEAKRAPRNNNHRPTYSTTDQRVAQAQALKAKFRNKPLELQ